MVHPVSIAADGYATIVECLMNVMPAQLVPAATARFLLATRGHAASAMNRHATTAVEFMNAACQHTW